MLALSRAAASLERAAASLVGFQSLELARQRLAARSHCRPRGSLASVPTARRLANHLDLQLNNLLLAAL
jgi:hypothetical protein